MADTHLATVGDLIDYLSRYGRDERVFLETEDFSDVGCGWSLERIGLPVAAHVVQRDADTWREVEYGGTPALIISHYSP